jgi:hypothetical protein
MIIVITGSRIWTNEAQIKDRLQRLQQEHENLTIVVGYDPIADRPQGVDKMVYKWCDVLGISVIPEPADWKNGRIIRAGNRNVNLAGFDRNELMLDKHKPGKVVAFRAKGKSNGTDHCIKEARRRNIEVEVNHEQDNRSNS